MSSSWLKGRFCYSLSVALAAVAALVMVTTTELAAAEWQTADEIRAQLIGNGAKLKGYEDGVWWIEEYMEDGEIKGMWGTDLYKGKWSFDGDLMCFDYKGTVDDECWYLAIDGKKVMWWDPDGKFAPPVDKYLAP